MKLIKWLSILIAIIVGFPAFSETIKIGISTGPSVQIMELAKKIAKSEYDLDLKTIVFTDYQLPNEALNTADIDANIFQTNSFLEQVIAKKGYDLAVAGNTFIYPMGIYSHKITKLSALPKNAVVVIPNDLSNQGRALLLLQEAKLIRLSSDAGKLPSLKDIATYMNNLKITTISAAQVARAVDDATIVVLNNDFVTNAGFKADEALFKEDAKTAQPYVNVIVVRKVDQDKATFKKLTEIMHKPEIVALTEKLFPGAVRAW